MFGQPFISLLSPMFLPNIILDHQNQHGNLFTLFLTNPLFAFCYICNIQRLTTETFNKCQEQIKYIFIEIARCIYKSKLIDSVFLQFSNDDFIRMFLLRFVFCYAALKLHRGFKGEDFYPSSQPQMPKDILENKQIQMMVLDLASFLNTRQLFLDLNEA